MSVVWRLSLLALFSASLFGCQTRLDLVVINHLNEQISATVGNKTEPIEPGKSARLHYPGGVEHGELLIYVHSCTLSYKTPADFGDYSWRSNVNGVVPVQLEADFKLYAIPPDATSAVTLSEVIPFQKGGFPLSPLKRECR